MTFREGRVAAFAVSRSGVRATVEALCDDVGHWPGAARQIRVRQRDDVGPIEKQVSDDPFAVIYVELAAAVRRGGLAAYLLAAKVEAAIRKAMPTTEVTPAAFSSDLHAHPFLVKDVLRYRAAAFAVANAERLPGDHATPEAFRDLLGRLADDWRGLFSPTERSYRSLNRTLDALPARARDDDVWMLRRFRLEQPLASGLHLRVLAEVARVGNRHLELHGHLIQHASENLLRELLDSVAVALDRSRAKIGDKIHLFAEFMAAQTDCPAGMGLRAILRRALACDTMPRRNRPIAVVRPPIGVPEDRGIRFLSTRQEIVDEGRRMQHCIGARAVEAVDGNAFFFHVEHEGCQASAQVDASGRVVEVRGPANETNLACTYAAEVIGRWGNGFRNKT